MSADNFVILIGGLTGFGMLIWFGIKLGKTDLSEESIL